MDFGPTNLKTPMRSYWISNKSQRNKETLENKGNRTQKREKGTTTGLRQRKQVARGSRQRLAILEEEARHQRMAHAPSHAGEWETRLNCAIRACDSRAPFRPPDLMVGVSGGPRTFLLGWCRPTLSQTLCLKKKTPSVLRIPPKFLQKICLFSSKFKP